jgi:hypothetical protein
MRFLDNASPFFITLLDVLSEKMLFGGKKTFPKFSSKKAEKLLAFSELPFLKFDLGSDEIGLQSRGCQMVYIIA